MPVTQEMLDEVALSAAEYEMIVDRLDREPNPLELGMFGSLWSEHCGYKHSKALLRRFPNTGPRVMVKPGEENAGVVDIGGGLAVTMKIESHNHPSAIEPYQGAATGVGGIVRDIFTMGARPIALLNSLRFGAPNQPQNRRLLQGVVAGIGGYGNCLGIPNVGGEVFFDDAYGENPLVNAMCVGLLSHGDLVSSTAKGPGNSIMLVGAETGRDGIHGASGLASRSFEETKELRSAVQVGNPFLEKCLIEACLEAAALDEVVAMQDLGAAGLTSAAIESAAKGGTRPEDRRRQGPPPRVRHDTLRGDALRIARAHARRRRTGPRGPRPRHLRPLGPHLDHHRRDHRRRPRANLRRRTTSSATPPSPTSPRRRSTPRPPPSRAGWRRSSRPTCRTCPLPASP